ncbi:MAG: hypothetical protein ACFFD1_00910 [Candidatus Thorarchaeota archaeon]
MKCENCGKFIWFWNKWRKNRGIVIDSRHPKYMLTIQFCSEECYIKYSEQWKWFSKIPEDFHSFLKRI